MHRSLLAALALACAVLTAAAPPLPPHPHGRSLDAWLADLDDPDLLLREEAIEVLGTLGPKARRAVPKLERLIRHESQSLRTRSAVALWRITGSPKLAVRVLATSLRDSAPLLRRDALVALGEMGGDAGAAVEVVLPCLDDRDAAVRAQASQTLGRMGRSSLPGLFRSLEDKKPRVRRNAMTVLYSAMELSLTADDLPTFRRRLTDADLGVRVSAACVLWGRGQADADILPVFRDGLAAADVLVRTQILTALTETAGKPKELLPLLDAVLQHGDATSKATAARLHFAIEPQPARVLPVYLALLTGPDRNPWPAAIAGLGDLGKAAEPAMPKLIEILKIPEFSTGNALRGTLQRIGPACIPDLVDVLRDTTKTEASYSVLPHHVAAGVLGRLGPPAAQAVLPLLGDASAEVRQRAVGVLQAIGPDARDAVPRLVALLDDDALRDASTQALASIGSGAKGAQKHLLRLAADGEAVERTASLRALVGIRPDLPAALPVIGKAIHDKDAGVQLAGLALLVHLDPKHPDVLPTCREVLAKPAYRSALFPLFARLGDAGREFLPIVLEALDDANEAAHVPAVRVLAALGVKDRDAVGKLLTQLQATDGDLQLATLEALAGLDADPAATVPALIAFARRPNNYIGYQALEIVAGYGPRAAGAYPDLLAVCRDAQQPPINRAQAGLALAQIDPERARKELRVELQALHAIEPSNLMAMRAVLRLDPDDKAAVAAIDAALHSVTATTRGNACLQVGLLGPAGKRFLPTVRKLERDFEPYVRLHAAYARWRITGEAADAKRVFVAMLDGTEEDYVRMQAAVLCGDLGADGKELLPALAATARDSETLVRQWCEQAQRKIERASARKKP